MNSRAAGAVQIVTALVVLGSVAVAAAPLTWHLRGETGARPPVPSAPVAAAEGPRPAVDVEPILTLAPFGRIDAPAPAPAEAVALDMTLLGIITRGNAADSLALIDANGTPANYKAGNKVGPAILDQVNADHVVLLVDGARQVLGFPNAELEGADPDAETASDPSASDSLLAAALAPPATEDYTEPPPPPPPVTTQDYIDLWRARIIANPKQVLDEIGLVPSDGGYTIAPDPDSGVTRAGLQTGDVVKTVNGQPVGDLDRDRILYDEVAASGVATLEIEREGRLITLSFPLR